MKPLRVACSVAVTSLLLATTVAPAPSSANDGSFYDIPANLPRSNGAIIKSEPSKLVNYGLPALAKSQRIMYRSTDRQGDPMAVTGQVLTPRHPWIGLGERPIVAYAIGTHGLGDQCAPSRTFPKGDDVEGLLVRALLVRGYGVVVTDYEGLGTAEPHTYMVRKSQAHAVLDSIRAAQRLPEAELPDAGPVAIAGYSQGGGASAAAAELAHTYAPELNVRGAYAGAVPADLAAVGRYLDGAQHAGFAMYAARSLALEYDVNVRKFLNKRGRAVLRDVAKQCNAESIEKYAGTKTKTLTKSGESLAQLLDRQPFRRIVNQQRIGNRIPQLPMLITHSPTDDVIPYKVGKRLAAGYCKKGVHVRFKTLPETDHGTGGATGFPDAVAFLEERFLGLPPSGNCA